MKNEERKCKLLDYKFWCKISLPEKWILSQCYFNKLALQEKSRFPKQHSMLSTGKQISFR